MTSTTQVLNGTLNVGTLVLLPRGTIYPGTSKHYSVVSVQTNLEQVYDMEGKMSSETAWEAGSPPTGGAASHPAAEAEGLTAWFDKGESYQCLGE